MAATAIDMECNIKKTVAVQSIHFVSPRRMLFCVGKVTEDQASDDCQRCTLCTFFCTTVILILFINLLQVMGDHVVW